MLARSEPGHKHRRNDAEKKANNALTSYHQLAHSVFRNSRISLHIREQLANSLCLSRLIFGVETWLYTTPAATAQIHNVRRMRIGRGLIGQNKCSSCNNTTDAEVLDEFRWLPTEFAPVERTLQSSCKAVQGRQQTVASSSQSSERSNGNTFGRLEMGARGLHCSAADARSSNQSRG